MNKKYLLLTSYTFPETSGSGINAFNFANALRGAGQHSLVLSFKRSWGLKSNSKVKRIPYCSRNIFGKIISLPIVLSYYIWYILWCDVLFIYGNKIIAWELAVLFANISGKKVVFQSLLPLVDNAESMLGDNSLRRPVYRSVFNKIDCYYAINSRFTREWGKYFGLSKVFEATQGVDLNKFNPLNIDEQKKKELYGTSSSLVVVSAGNLIHRKGFEIVFEALAKGDLMFDFFVFGEYEFDNKHFLRNKREEASELYHKGMQLLKERIHFLGFKPDLSEYLRHADVLIHGGRIEGFPNVFLEAMASGIPVITAPIEGVTESMLKNKVNCLVYENQSELLEMLTLITEMPKLKEKITSNALAFVNNNGNFEVVITRLNEFLFQ